MQEINRHTTTSDWEQRFDDEVDRLIARSLRDPSCKPLTELKKFVAAEKAKSFEEGAARAGREIVEKVNQLSVHLIDARHSSDPSPLRYSQAVLLDDVIKLLTDKEV
jgi:hypothetical protein